MDLIPSARCVRQLVIYEMFFIQKQYSNLFSMFHVRSLFLRCHIYYWFGWMHENPPLCHFSIVTPALSNNFISSASKRGGEMQCHLLIPLTDLRPCCLCLAGQHFKCHVCVVACQHFFSTKMIQSCMVISSDFSAVLLQGAGCCTSVWQWLWCGLIRV